MHKSTVYLVFQSIIELSQYFIQFHHSHANFPGALPQLGASKTAQQVEKATKPTWWKRLRFQCQEHALLNKQHVVTRWYDDALYTFIEQMWLERNSKVVWCCELGVEPTTKGLIISGITSDETKEPGLGVLLYKIIDKGTVRKLLAALWSSLVLVPDYLRVLLLNYWYAARMPQSGPGRGYSWENWVNKQELKKMRTHCT